MTGLRRVLTVISRTSAVAIGAAVPDSATFADAVHRPITPTVDPGHLDDQCTLSVITLTSYGRTAETPRTAVPAC
jgi:hypothetical protein